jgi:hypothetical protein
MARRRRSRRSRSSGDGVKIALGSVAVVVSVALLAGYGYLRSTAEDRPPLVAETLCPVDGERSLTVVLLDTTDDIAEITQQEISTFLIDIAETLPEFGRLELRLVSPQVAAGELVFDKCNPGDGSNLSEWAANPELARRRWLEEFRLPLDAALERARQSGEAETSPIIDTIQNIAASRFLGRRAEALPKHLMVISDMIENTPAYTQYGGDVSYDRYRETDAYSRQHTDLAGARVTIRYMRRLGLPIDSGEHIQFWIDWVDDNGGVFEEAKILQGAG